MPSEIRLAEKTRESGLLRTVCEREAAQDGIRSSPQAVQSHRAGFPARMAGISGGRRCFSDNATGKLSELRPRGLAKHLGFREDLAAHVSNGLIPLMWSGRGGSFCDCEGLVYLASEKCLPQSSGIDVLHPIEWAEGFCSVGRYRRPVRVVDGKTVAPRFG